MVCAAAAFGHVAALRALLERGRADPDARATWYGSTPAFIASAQGHCACVKLLASHGAALDTPAHNGATALYIASQNGHFKCARELVQAGVTVDPKMTSCGSTPLQLAIFIAQRDNDKPHRDIVELLLSNGASIDHKNNAGLTALELAADDNNLIQLVLDEKERRAKGGNWWN